MKGGSMTLFVVKCTLLCAMMSGTLCACMLKNHTLWIERHDFAKCVAINTTICSGYCYTQDTNLKGRFGRTFLIQRSCVPLSLTYHVALIPDASQDVSPQLYYPAARRCTCGHCDTRSHHCVRTRWATYNQCPMMLGNKTQSAKEM